MKKIIFILTILTLFIGTVRAQTIFGWETATDTGATITETINDITVTLSGDPDLELFSGNGFGGTSGDVALTQNTITSVTFTFDQPIVVNSIIPIDANGTNVDYIFTPTGGSNVPVTTSLILGEAPTVNLNWVNVTSFTVTASGAAFGFDDLSVDTGTNGQTFFEWETAANSGGTITETVNGIGVTVSGGSSYSVTDYGNASGTSGNVILSNATRTAITFTFDDPVVVNSILALEGNDANIEYTFTPTGGTNNDPVTASLVSGVTAVRLNWIGVTGFTVTSFGAAFGFDNLSVTGIGSETLFDFDTNVTEYTQPIPDTGEPFPWYITETIDGITVKIESVGMWPGNSEIFDPVYIETQDNPFGGLNGRGTGDVAHRANGTSNPVLITFSEPVVVNSILAFEWAYARPSKDLTFIPTGGTNSPVTATTAGGSIETPTINLNWIGVTSITITAGELEMSLFMDDLSVYGLLPLPTLGLTDTYSPEKTSVYPNPVADILTIKNGSDLKSIRVYNLLGQQVLESKEAVIDVSELSQGMYVLQIHTEQGMETKRIVKK